MFVAGVLSSAYAGSSIAAEQANRHKAAAPVNKAFPVGEKLTYIVSWSNLMDAGVADLEVMEDQVVGSTNAYRFVGTARSLGIVESFFPIRISIESMMDSRRLHSLSFKLDETMGKKKRKRSFLFDHETHTAKYLLNQDPPEMIPFTGEVQDTLSVLYYVRTRGEFKTEKPFVVTVFESGKTWSLDVVTAGKEHITTPAGEFNTIILKTNPPYESVFSNKSEITMWITDDDRKIPVLVKSRIMIGSVVFTLNKIEMGKKGNELSTKPQTTQ